MRELILDANVQELLNRRNFSMAVSSLNKEIISSPKRSALYIGRLLADRGCASIEELIKKGFDPERDSDFILATHFANDEENAFYTQMKQQVNQRMTQLTEALTQAEKKHILQTGISEQRVSLKNEAERLREKLNQQLRQLSEAERKVADSEAECGVVTDAYKKSSETHFLASVDLRNEINKKEEITDIEKSNYLIQLKTNKDACAECVNKLLTFENTGLHKRYVQAIQTRDMAKSEVQKTIDEIAELTAKQKSLIDENKRIQTTYRDAREAVSQGRFEMTDSLI